jgi:hypothetical protein
VKGLKIRSLGGEGVKEKGFAEVKRPLEDPAMPANK